AGPGVAHHHVAGAAAREVAKATDLPIKPHGSHEARAGDLIVADIVDLDPAGVDVAQHHVGFAEAAEIAEAHDLPGQADLAGEGGAGNVVADVVALEAAGPTVAQQHVAGIAAIEAAEGDEAPIGPDLAERVAGEDGVAADVVDLVLACDR